MIALFDTSEDIAVCRDEIGGDAGQLLTPLTRFSLQYPELPWAIDNGAFAGFNQRAFIALLEREKHRQQDCVFVAVPDVVGSARRTLEIFDRWRTKLYGWKLALVAQDGQEDLPLPWDYINAVFIGGSTKFKVSDAAAQIVSAAKILGKWVHVGRINEGARFKHFEELGADSFDGTGISRYSHMRHAIARRDHQMSLEGTDDR